ncbi:MAG: hypothetical protein E7592_01960 [Ruminococcaceae bacterium]|nr:hypothetical protein [Oscillospiraceae bacterium]
MKKFILILTALILCISMVSCDGSSKSALDRGDEIVELVSEMVKSDEYINIMLGNVSLYDEILAEIKAMDFSKVTAIYDLKVSQDELIEIMGANRGDIDKLPKSLKDRFVRGLGSSLASHINSKAGTEELVISSLFNASKCYVDKSIKENQYLLYVFESGYSMLISFIPHEDGAVTASGSLILKDMLEFDTADKVEASFIALGIKTITATKLK